MKHDDLDTDDNGLDDHGGGVGGITDDSGQLATGLDTEPSVLSDDQTQPGVFPDNTDLFDQSSPYCWCEPGLPNDWQTWTAPTEPSPDSFTDYGYSTDWGQVQPDWGADGQDPFTYTEPEVPITDDVVGPGHADDVYWRFQGNTQYCAIYSVRAVLSEMYGVDVDPQEVIDRANANGWLQYDANGNPAGVLPQDIHKIFASFGVPSHEFTANDGDPWQGLNTALDNNQRVVLALDSGEIWGTDSPDEDVVKGPGADHAVAITGIDYTRGVVIVNDSGQEGGAGFEIPINEFYNAWQDSNFEMTVTDASAPGGQGAEPPAGASTLDQSAPGFVQLPFTLHPGVKLGG